MKPLGKPWLPLKPNQRFNLHVAAEISRNSRLSRTGGDLATDPRLLFFCGNFLFRCFVPFPVTPLSPFH